MSNQQNKILKIQRTMKALAQNNIDSYFAENHEAAAAIVQTLIEKGDTISCGGSMSLEESGILGVMNNGDYNFLDRSLVSDPKEIKELYQKVYGCDAFFTSANAVTENGELYNVDGNGNRISAIIHGPKKIIVIVGENKIVKDIDAAVYRVKTIAAPCNGVRLNTGTPCAVTGVCAGINGGMTNGCKSDRRMCAHYLVSAFQRTKGRITVIFLNEELGY